MNYVSLVFALLLLPFLILYYAWAAAILWGWFLVPLGAPVIPTTHMMGIMLFLWVLRPRNAHTNDADTWTSFWVSMLTPLYVLTLGWVLR